MRMDMCIDMCIGMCMDMCQDMYLDMCLDICIDMFTDICIDIWIDTCVDMWVGMSLCIDKHMILQANDRIHDLAQCVYPFHGHCRHVRTCEYMALSMIWHRSCSNISILVVVAPGRCCAQTCV